MLTSNFNGRPFRGWSPMDDLFGWGSAQNAPVTVEQSDDFVFLSVDMPGVDENDVELTFERGSLWIAGKRGDFMYRYTVFVGDEVDPDAIEAQLDKGVLTIRAGKRPEAKPRKIPLHGGTESKILDVGER